MVSKKKKFFTKIETDFSAEIGTSNVFSAQNQVVSKKKQKKKVFTEIETDFSAEIGNSNVFSAQNQVVSKKKKKGLHRLRGGCFPMGGLFSIFSQKIGLKTTKNVRFCILHKPIGGLEPPRPGYATDRLPFCSNFSRQLTILQLQNLALQLIIFPFVSNFHQL